MKLKTFFPLSGALGLSGLLAGPPAHAQQPRELP
jgi:hypothetical protein